VRDPHLADFLCFVFGQFNEWYWCVYKHVLRVGRGWRQEIYMIEGFDSCRSIGRRASQNMRIIVGNRYHKMDSNHDDNGSENHSDGKSAFEPCFTVLVVESPVSHEFGLARKLFAQSGTERVIG